jgi:hypothetical protein
VLTTRITCLGAALAAALLATLGAAAAAAQERERVVEAALTNIATLHRPGMTGYATFWDGNKYIQCRAMPDKAFRCEAAGALMQPSLGRVLTPERIARLAARGWQLDPSFGNYVQTFPPGLSPAETAQRIAQALGEGYGADIAALEVGTDWIANVPCPPRNGPGQNLAGMVNDAPSMASTAVRGCAYTPPADHRPADRVRAKADLARIYGARVAGEIQRLRINLDRHVFVVMDTGGGYVQCAPEASPSAIYCEAQSAQTWPVLSRILTPERLARLHAAGYAEPGRAPNYWKIYPAGDFSDAAIADELLTILYEVYGYDGSPALEFKTEKGPG